MKNCPHCIKGKILPLIPIKGAEVDKLPDCDYCNGTGKYRKIDGKLYFEALRLRDLRTSKLINMRKFCMDNGFNPVEISKIERGLLPATNEITKAYEDLHTQQH